MAYIVTIEAGSQGDEDYVKTNSLPLSTKVQARKWIKNSSFANQKTKIVIQNTKTWKKEVIYQKSKKGKYTGRCSFCGEVKPLNELRKTVDGKDMACKYLDECKELRDI